MATNETVEERLGGALVSIRSDDSVDELRASQRAGQDI